MYNLLIVDDEYEIRHGISNYIPWDEFGFTVIGEAENGEEALDFIVNHHVDVVLCDIKMPIKSGLELAGELKSMNHPAKVIFLTGHKEFQLVQEALVYGAWNYIVKPTKYLELADIFQKLKLALDQANISEEDELDVDDDDLIIKEIKRYTLENFKTVQLKDLGLKVHMNPTYISTYFKKKTGLSFSDYVLSIKMERAAAYLLDPTLRIFEISELIGYSNPKNFTKAFGSYYGKNPRQYRSLQ